MGPSNEYSNVYKKLDNNRLLRIIEESEKYKPEAIKAAELELTKRKVSMDEIELVKSQLLERRQKSQELTDMSKVIGGKLRNLGNEFIETINPIQRKPQTTGRKINLIVIFFAIIAAYQVINEADFIGYIFRNSSEAFGVYTFFYFIPMIGLLIGTIFFALRMKMGWVLICSYISYVITNATWSFIEILWPKTNTPLVDHIVGNIQIEMHQIDDLFPSPSLFETAIVLAVFGITLWGICRRDIKDVFMISEKTVALTIFGAVFLTVISLI